MAVIKKFAENLTQNLTTFQTYLVDTNPNSTYFKVTEFKDTFTGGKNGFLIEGSEHLMESTEIKIEILDVAGNPIYYEPGNGVPEYYEGTSKLVAVYVYEDTPIGSAKITILGELKTYLEDGKVLQPIPDEWKNVYNLKWEKEFTINKLLSNEDKVRFYKRPEVTIDEIVKPIFSNVVTPITQMGFADGFAQVPAQGEKLSEFSLPTNYLIQINDGGAWTGSVVGTNVEFTDLGFSSVADDVISKTNLTLTTPYSVNGIVQNFSNQRYTSSFNYLEGIDQLKTALTGSFGKITISDLETFVGDVARVKIFRKSQSDLADYQFIQEIQLESNELLKDLESTTKNEEFYGIFDNTNYKNYWVTSSNTIIPPEFNQTFLYNSVRLDSNPATPIQFFTSKSINITQNSEYTLDFNVKLLQNVSAGNYIKFYMSGSRTENNITTAVSQEILTIISDSKVLQKSNITTNFQSQQFDNAKLYIEVNGLGWYISDVSLRVSQESSFSPNEISFIQPIPRTLPKETFDFLFQFYDINNNYIPVVVEESKTFDGGNLNRINKSLELIPSSLYFQFDSGSGNGNPIPPTAIFIDVVKNFLTGSVTFTSRSFDFFNNELSSSQYSYNVTPGYDWWQFPGLLNDIDTDRPFLTVQNFTGSRDPQLEDIVVQFIEYTGECEGISDSIIITRVVDGKGGVNYELRPYNGQFIRNSDPSGSLEVQAIRIDGVNEIKLRAGLPAGMSAPQIHVQSGSTYLTLNDASLSGFVKGLQPGTTGSGELNYNAIFNRDSIDGQLNLYLIPSGSDTPSASILTVLTLTDLQDGLDAGVVLYDVDTFTINPRLETNFTPTFSSATASFFRRGRFDEPISCSIEVYPSMSINKDFTPEYWINYITHSCNPDISVVAYDAIGNIITSSLDAATYAFGNPTLQSKQLLVNFVYIEPWTSASVSVDKLFTIVPEGKPGDESIVFEVNPIAVTLGANSRGIVNDYNPSITDIRLKQGSRYLSFTGSREPGTFHIATASIYSSNITGGLIYFDNTYTASLIISASSDMTDLSGSITYPLEIQPYYTSSVYTASVVQPYTKVLEGPPPIQILITPPNVTLTADEVGFVTSVGYTPANTIIQVKEGEDFLIFTQSSAPGTFRINSIQTGSGSIPKIQQNPPFTGLNNLGTLAATASFNRFDYPFVSASALYTIQVYPFALGAGHQPTSSIYTRTQTFTKNVSVPNARSVDFKASSYTVNYDRNGRVSDASAVPIIVSATAFNTTSSADKVFLYLYDIASDGSEGGEQIFTGDVGSNPVTFTLPDVNYYDIGPDTIKTYKVKIVDGDPYISPTVNPFRAEAQLTISGLKAGADSYKLVSTNDNCSITADLWTTQFSGSGIKITTFNGTQQLTNANPLPLPNDPNDLDFNNEPIGVLGFSSASIITKSNYITLPSQLIGNPATIGNITNWVAPAINNAGTIVYRVDFEGDSSTVNASIRPLARQTQFVTQSIAVQFTPPAPYDIKMTNENTSVVYKVAGNISFDGTGTIIRVYRGNVELINTASFVGPDGGQNDAYGRYGYPNKSRVSILSKSDWISLAGGLIPGQHVSGTPATMQNIIGWENPTINPTAEIVYQIDCEYSGSLISGSTLFKTQSLAIQYEGNVGPGIVMRGEWSEDIDYIGQVDTTNNRRDAVTYLATPDTVKYYAANSGSGPTTGTPTGYHAPTVDGNNEWWEYLGEQDFFVAAKIAIFEESYVKNTINVGTKDGTGAFANIVLAGGRTDPYIAIGQNATVGTAGTSGTSATPTGVIGYDRPGIFLGIYEDGNAGTTGRFSIKTTGTSGKGLFWDGDTLTIVGSIRQREPGIPEGVFRGVWSVGETYYPDDTVTYGGSSYINSITHTSTNDTNIDTGYPPSATNSWTVFAAAGTSGTAGLSGTSGDSGAGVVFRGNFSTSTLYYHTTERRDIVRAGSTFYLANNKTLDGQAGTSWGTPPNTNWTTFGAQFTSVATDVLFATEQYVDKTINIGEKGGNSLIVLNANESGSNANPYISIGQISSSIFNSWPTQSNVQGFNNNGIFLGYDGNIPKFSLKAASGSLVWDSTGLEINGSVTSNNGIIGGWVIEQGKIYSSENNIQLISEPSESIVLFDDSGSLRFLADTKLTLPTPSGVTYTSPILPNISTASYMQNGTPFTDEGNPPFSNNRLSGHFVRIPTSNGVFTATKEGKHILSVNLGNDAVSTYAEAFGEANCYMQIYMVLTKVDYWNPSLGIDDYVANSNVSSVYAQGTVQQNYVWNGFFYETYYTPTYELYKLPANQKFNITAELQNGETYYVTLLASYYMESLDTSTLYGFSSFDSYANIEYAMVATPSVSINAISAGTTINGGGFQSVISDTKFLRVLDGVNGGENNNISFSTHITGSLMVDQAISKTTYKQPGYPAAVKAFGRVTYIGGAKNSPSSYRVDGSHNINTATLSIDTFAKSIQLDFLEDLGTDNYEVLLSTVNTTYYTNNYMGVVYPVKKTSTYFIFRFLNLAGNIVYISSDTTDQGITDAFDFIVYAK